MTPLWGVCSPYYGPYHAQLEESGHGVWQFLDSAALDEELEEGCQQDQRQQGRQHEAGSPPHRTAPGSGTVAPGGIRVTALPTRSLCRTAAL